MIEVITNAIAENVDPLSVFIGLAFGVAADEAGRKMLRNMANERLDQILGEPCNCENCEHCDCSGGQ